MVATNTSLGELSSYGIARSTVNGAPLPVADLKKLHTFESGQCEKQNHATAKDESDVK